MKQQIPAGQHMERVQCPEIAFKELCEAREVVAEWQLGSSAVLCNWVNVACADNELK